MNKEREKNSYRKQDECGRVVIFRRSKDNGFTTFNNTCEYGGIYYTILKVICSSELNNKK